LIAEAETLKQQGEGLKELAKNPFQPVPEMVEIDTMVNQEKVNAELQPNQILVKLTGGPQIAGLDATYI